MDARTVLENYNEAVLNQHKLDRLDEFTSSEQLKSAATAFVRAFPDLRVELDFTVAEGTMIGCHAKGEGTHSGTAIRGLEPKGRSWTAACNAFFRVEEGKIVQAWTLWDWASIMKQIATE